MEVIKMKIKIISLVLGILLILLSGCRLYGNNANNEYTTYQTRKLPDGTLELIIGDEKYTTRVNTEWFPNDIMISDYDDIVGICKYGYIFKTSSNNCLFVTMMGNSSFYHFFKYGYELDEVSIEYIKEGIIASYGDIGYNKGDNGPYIDITDNIDRILEIYSNNSMYEDKNFKQQNYIGNIVFQNKKDEALISSISLYKEENNYYMSINDSGGQYVKCNEIIPEDIYKLEEYKKETFGF
jgi:lipoprotein